MGILISPEPMVACLREGFDSEVVRALGVNSVSSNSNSSISWLDLDAVDDLELDELSSSCLNRSYAQCAKSSRKASSLGDPVIITSVSKLFGD